MSAAPRRENMSTVCQTRLYFSILNEHQKEGHDPDKVAGCKLIRTTLFLSFSFCCLIQRNRQQDIFQFTHWRLREKGHSKPLALRGILRSGRKVSRSIREHGVKTASYALRSGTRRRCFFDYRLPTTDYRLPAPTQACRGLSPSERPVGSKHRAFAVKTRGSRWRCTI